MSANQYSKQPQAGRTRASIADEDLKRYLGERPLRINRRELLGMMAATMASVAITGTAAAAPSEAGQPQLAAAQSPSTEKIVTAWGEDLDELDPHYFKSIPAYFAVANLYDNLFAYDYEQRADGSLFPATDSAGNWKLLPWLLESWQVSPDEKTLTFKLRKDVTFSDGSPLTSADVIATWHRGVSDTSVYSKSVFNLMTVMKPEQITAPDEYTVVVQLEQPTVFALKMIATNVLSIMSAKAIQAHATSKDPTAHEYFHAHPVGSTAYVLSKWTPGVEWDLAPNPNYWNKPVLKNGGVVNRLVPDATQRASLLRGGDVDIAFDLLPKDMDAMRNDPNISLFNFTVPWPYYLGMNNKLPPFNNVKVRQAVSYAIPYDTIIKQVMFGFAEPCRSPIATGMPTSDYSFWHFEGGPAKAKQLLEQAGIKNLSFDLAIRVGFPTFEQIAIWIQSGLSQAGAEVNIIKMTDAEYLQKFNSFQLPAFIAEWYSWVNDPFYHLYWNFLSTNTGTNGSAYSNPQVDQLIKAGLYETDPAKRESLSKQAQKIIVDEAPWGLLFQINNVVAASKKIKGYQWNTDTAARFWMVSKG